MSHNREDSTSRLFLVRIRGQTAGEPEQQENDLWCGHVQRVVTGETYSFRGWTELVERLGTLLSADGPQAESESNE